MFGIVSKALSRRNALSVFTRLAVLGSLVPGLSDAAVQLSDKVDLTGDFRYRAEYTDGSNAYRSRHRIRARLGVIGEATEEVDFGFQLVLGSGRPTSTNQDLGASFSGKPVTVDLAYVSYAPAFLPGASFSAGKMKNPFHRIGYTDLIWDGDVNPEGLSAKHVAKLGPVELTSTATGYWVEERSAGADSWMIGAQLSSRIKASEAVSFRAGASYYDYTDTVGNKQFVSAYDYGNTLSGGKYVYDYDVLEGFAGIEANLGPFPVTAHFDYARNLAIGHDNSGWEIGTTIGKTFQSNVLSFFYSYREVDSDVTVGALSGSGFSAGGVNGRGHYTGLWYFLRDNAHLRLEWSLSSNGVNAPIIDEAINLDLNIAL